MIIGFVGRKGSGKDTAADYLQQVAAPLHTKNLTFAGYLKTHCAMVFGDVYGVPPEHFFGSQAQKEAPLEAYGLPPGTSGRGILQHLGTEGFRAIDGDFHTRATMCQVYGADVYLFRDVRFPNECDVLRARGGVLVRMTRARASGDLHASETALDDYECDYALRNETWTLEELQARVADLFHVLST